jgi:hypothetical protein
LVLLYHDESVRISHCNRTITLLTSWLAYI